MKLKKLATGLYESPSGRYHVVKDGYESVRDEAGRWTVRFDNLDLAPEEVCWIVIDMTQGSDGTNLAIFDTLRECRLFLDRLDK